MTLGKVDAQTLKDKWEEPRDIPEHSQSHKVGLEKTTHPLRDK